MTARESGIRLPRWVQTPENLQTSSVPPASLSRRSLVERPHAAGLGASIAIGGNSNKWTSDRWRANARLRHGAQPRAADHDGDGDGDGLDPCRRRAGAGGPRRSRMPQPLAPLRLQLRMHGRIPRRSSGQRAGRYPAEALDLWRERRQPARRDARSLYSVRLGEDLRRGNEFPPPPRSPAPLLRAGRRAYHLGLGVYS